MRSGKTKHHFFKCLGHTPSNTHMIQHAAAGTLSAKCYTPRTDSSAAALQQPCKQMPLCKHTRAALLSLAKPSCLSVYATAAPTSPLPSACAHSWLVLAAMRIACGMLACRQHNKGRRAPSSPPPSSQQGKRPHSRPSGVQLQPSMQRLASLG